MFTRRKVAVLTLLLVGFAPGAAWALTASSPDDICAPTDDPCVVGADVVLDDATHVFDFGTRTLKVAAGGKLDAGAAYREITCGGLIVEDDATFQMNRKLTDVFYPGLYGGYVRMFVNGHCDDDPATACTADSACAGSTCTGGDVSISGLVDGRARVYSSLYVSATGAITLDGRIDFRGRPAGTEASEVRLTAGKSIVASGMILARRRGSKIDDSTPGGDITLIAGDDVSLTDVVIDVRGGDASAGTFKIEAGGNVTASGDFRMNATGGGGYGGIFRMDAAGNAVINGKSDGRPTIFNLRGHSSYFRGGGGSFVVSADADATLSEQVQVLANGDNYPGGYIEVTAWNAVTIGGLLSAAPSGTYGLGGVFYLSARGPATISSTAIIEVGPERNLYDGQAIIYAGGLVRIDGDIVATGSPGSGPTGSIAIHGSDDVIVTGRLFANGRDGGYPLPISIEGCDVSIVSDGLLSTNADYNNRLRVSARESMLIDSGASILAPGSQSSVEIAYRDPSNPPSVLGTVVPAPTIFVDDTLAACP